MSCRLPSRLAMCFRPLIGVNFCKRLQAVWMCSRTLCSFRPLIGVNFCKPEIFQVYCRRLHGVSVPLSGLTSVNKTLAISGVGLMIYGFRPLIGVNFCKLLEAPRAISHILSFRPLIGVNFCKRWWIFNECLYRR